MKKKLALKTKLLVSFFGVCITPFAFMAVIALTKAESSLRLQSFAQMQRMRDVKKDQVEQYLQTIKYQALSFSKDPMIISAMADFSKAFDAFSVENGMPPSDVDNLRQRVATYYENEFSTAYGRWNEGRLPEVDPIVSQLNDRTIALQYHYIKANPYPLGLKDKLNRAQDSSRYSEVHAHYHPLIRNFLEKFGYYDICLVQPDTGDIVYSVLKELDFATSLKSGPYARTHFSDAFRKANAANASDTVVFSDLEAYFPSYEAPAGFVASPIFKAGTRIGVLIFQFPIGRLNAIMDERTGMGQTGQTYLVGSDLLMRSGSNLDPGRHSALASYTHPFRDSVDTQAVRDALQGNTGKGIIMDDNGNPMLSAYTPIHFEGLQWVLLSKMDAAEAFAGVKALQWAAMVMGFIGVFGIVAVALLIMRIIARPVCNMVADLTDLSPGKGDLTACRPVNTQDEIGTLPALHTHFEVAPAGDSDSAFIWQWTEGRLLKPAQGAA